MTLPQNESDLIARASQGDKEAFGDLYEYYLDTIYRYIFYRVNNHQDTEDLTETVFLKVWQSLSGYRESKTPFIGWIYRIAQNTIIDHYRTQKELVQIHTDHFHVDETINLEEQVLSKEKTEQLMLAIGRLSPIHQHVLVLRFINGLTPAEVASALDKNVGAVRVLQHRALKALHALLAAEEITNV